MDFCLQGYIDHVVLVEADVGETLTQASYNYKRQKKKCLIHSYMVIEAAYIITFLKPNWHPWSELLGYSPVLHSYTTNFFFFFWRLITVTQLYG